MSSRNIGDIIDVEIEDKKYMGIIVEINSHLKYPYTIRHIDLKWNKHDYIVCDEGEIIDGNLQ
jgi:hypothetical protein